MPELKYLAAYAPDLQEQVRTMLVQNKLGAYLEKRYPERHSVQSDKALYQFTTDLKQQYLRNSPNIDKVLYDSKLDVLRGCRVISLRQKKRSASLRYFAIRHRNFCR